MLAIVVRVHHVQPSMNNLWRASLIPMVLALAGCNASRSSADLDGPMFGARRETTLLIETDRTVDVHELVRLAKVVRFYRNLSAHEVEDLRRRLQQEVDDLVDVELQSARPQLEKQKARLEVQHRKDLESVRADPGKARALQESHAIALQRLEQDAREQARQRVLARLGKDLALPVLTNDNRSVVAFGRMNGEQFQVTAKAYEIDVSISALKPEAKVITADGRKATLLGAPAAKSVRQP